MNSDRLELIRQNPPNRVGIGVLTRISEALRRALSRIFGKRHPADFDAEYGSFEFPEVNITEGAGGNMPRPLINRSCKKGILVYCYVSNRTPKCSFVGQLAALQDAIGQVSQYLQNDYRCENECCLQEIGELVWFGFGCRRFETADYAAVLVRFRCIPEL